MTDQPDFVYRLVTPDELQMAKGDGVLPLRPVDEKDGYIHLSIRQQLCETANLHFANHDRLYGVGFRPSDLAPHFGWHEAPKRGADFPHSFHPLAFSKQDHLLTLRKTSEGFVITEPGP